jgi:hypothetical protein
MDPLSVCQTGTGIPLAFNGAVLLTALVSPAKIFIGCTIFSGCRGFQRTIAAGIYNSEIDDNRPHLHFGSSRSLLPRAV